MQIRKNRCDVAEPRFLCDYPSKSVLDTLKIRNGCASQERIAEIKSGANYCCSYGFGSLSSERSPNVTQRTNMEITSLACFRHVSLQTFQNINISHQHSKTTLASYQTKNRLQNLSSHIQNTYKSTTYTYFYNSLSFPSHSVSTRSSVRVSVRHLTAVLTACCFLLNRKSYHGKSE